MVAIVEGVDGSVTVSVFEIITVQPVLEGSLLYHMKLVLSVERHEWHPACTVAAVPACCPV